MFRGSVQHHVGICARLEEGMVLNAMVEPAVTVNYIRD
jgi:hypothetical protein